MSGIPTLRGIEHIAVTVPDLDEAVKFFVEVVGCEHFYDMGTFADPEGTWMADNLDVHPRAEIPNFCLLRCQNGPNLELFEYRSPDQARRWPKMSDWGGHHLAFYVDDIDAAIAHVELHGVRVLGGRKDGVGVEAGKGSYFAHFLTPWGQLMEFVSYPEGKAYMQQTERRLWRPA